MHEWALAEAIVAAATEIADKERLREVTCMKIRVGELQQVDLDILEFALSQLKSGKLKNAKLEVEIENAKLKCRVCGRSWVFDKEKLDAASSEAIHFVPEVAHTYIKCPDCGSPDFEVLEGRGVLLQTVKGVR